MGVSVCVFLCVYDSVSVWDCVCGVYVAQAWWEGRQKSLRT